MSGIESRTLWEPIVDDPELEERALASVDEIGRTIPHVERFIANSHALAAGRAGHALFHGYRALVSHSSDDVDRSRDTLESALEALGTEPSDAGLMSGFTGVAWTVRHLGARLFPGSEEIVEQADETLRDVFELAARNGRWTSGFDLMTGLVGIGVYLLETPTSDGRAELVSQILDHLERSAVRLDGGTAWHTPPAAFDPGLREEYPDGYYNLGVAHGTPGVVGFLARVIAAGVERERASRMLDESARWVIARRLSGDPSPGYPNCFWPSREPPPSRTAWCYGNPGVAACLLAAAEVSGETSWRRCAIEIALEGAARSFEQSRIVDVGLCHGSAGLVLMFGRFFHATGDERFRDAARIWVRHTLDLRRADGIAGYSSYQGLDDADPTYHPDAAFLTGAAGVGLALLAAVSRVAPDWDRVLLTDVPLARS
jgi:lantibiotic modifying enzyme